MNSQSYKTTVGAFVLGGLALLVLGIILLGGGRLFSNDLVIQATVFAFFPAMQSVFPNLLPCLDVAPKLSKAAKLNIIIRQAGGWDLVKALEPERYACTPFSIAAHGMEPATKQAADIHRHKLKIAQVAIFWS